jgi:RimJ/RimL family protein N-acetyltransferase
MAEIVTRRLQQADWAALRAIRLLALRTEPGVFSGNLEAAEAQPQSWWEDLTRGTPHQAFGAFADDTIIGQITVFTWNDDPTGTTAFIGMLFVDPAYRGHGLSHRLLATATDWIRAQPRFRRAVIGHRGSNIASMRAILRQGFVEAGRQHQIWPDGTHDDEVDYVLDLKAPVAPA